MKITLTDRINNTRIEKLFQHSIASIFVHVLSAGFLLTVVWEAAKTEYVYHWLSMFVCSALLMLLCRSLYVRKSSTEAINTPKWEAWYVATIGLIGLIFSLGYSYTIFYANPVLWPTIAFVSVMHLALGVTSLVMSKKAMVVFALTSFVPLISILTTLHEPLVIVYTAGMGTFLIVSLSLGKMTHETSVLAIVMQYKYTSEVKTNNRYKTQLEKSTIEDPQTQIFNRRFFELMINEEIRRAKRAGSTLSVAIIEIDYFEEYLQHYGTEKTEQMLCSVAKILSKATSRGGEFITRFGPSSFSLLAPNVQDSEAIAFTSKMNDMIEQANIEHLATRLAYLDRVSISVGISEFKSGNIIDVEELIRQAQVALKTAATVGRNNIQVFAANVFTKDNRIMKSADNDDNKPLLAEDNNDVAQLFR